MFNSEGGLQANVEVTLKVLGISNAIDSGACLVVDGLIVDAVNEERFNRKKQTRDFPFQSIEWILQKNGLRLSDIDVFGTGAWNGVAQPETLLALVNEARDLSIRQGHYVIERIRERIEASVTSSAKGKRELFTGLKSLGVPEEKVIFCDHHRAHALTAFSPSPFEESLVLVADGRGDFSSLTLWAGSRRIKGHVSILDTISELTSVGAMYGFITNLLGFTPHKHEGKVTGLASRGKPTKFLKALREVLYFDKSSGKIVCTYGDYYQPFISAKPIGLQSMLLDVAIEDAAFAAQTVLEEIIKGYLSFHITRLGIEKTNLCLSGGIFANVKLNHELLKVSGVGQLFVAPMMGDGGMALGGAIYATLSAPQTQDITPLRDVYLGPEYSRKEYLEILETTDLPWRELTNQEKIELACNLLAEGKIVGWFQDRMEYGPRALGNRSILANPVLPNINEILNKRLNRSEFMPFAPVTTDDLAPKIFKDWDSQNLTSQFMTSCFEVTETMTRLCPNVVHVDNTARPQVISREKNSQYYDVIARFIEKTGVPALINTSFNHHEEPIVMSPRDAINSFLKGNVDALFLGDFLIINHSTPD